MRPGLIARLRERGVLRVAASYAVIAWLALQIADVVLEPWNLPAWVHRAPLVVALLGFPIAIALAWFLELGDGAVTRDAAADGAARPVVHGWRRHVDIAVISILGAIVGVLRDARRRLARRIGPPGAAASSPRAWRCCRLQTPAPTAISTSATGLSDELRNQFSRMQSLRVTARSSSIAFQDQSLDAVTIAGKLAVAALLEGTVGRGGGRLQVSVQLIDGRDGKVMWAERYDRSGQGPARGAARDRECRRRRGVASVRSVRPGRAGSADRGSGRLRSLPPRRAEGARGGRPGLVAATAVEA